MALPAHMMPPLEPSPGATALPCFLEVPEAYLPGARYALRMLLTPLGIDPLWVDGAHAAGAGLYYGPAPEAAGARVSLPLAPAAPSFFRGTAVLHAGDVDWTTWEGERWPVLFTAPPEGAADLVASTFYWLSGWHEVHVRRRDEHGRVPYAASLPEMLGVVLRPVVDAYREMLAATLQAAGVPVRRRRWAGRPWAFCATHDIDYLTKWRPGMVYRELVHYLLLDHLGQAPAERVRRLGRAARDWARPGDIFREAFVRMREEVAERGGTATYFLKMGAHGSHDVPYSPSAPFLVEQVRALTAAGFEVGLHPSYFAHRHRGYLKEERDRLASLTGTPPRSVRQHYLRFDPVQTPRLQEEQGFAVDSSLGFSEHEGFRRGTCLPYQLFDVAANRPLGLWEMPLSMMEATLFNRRHMEVDEAVVATRRLMETCRRFGGVCVALWHNILWDELDFPGWGAHFLAALDHAAGDGAQLASLASALEAWHPAP